MLIRRGVDFVETIDVWMCNREEVENVLHFLVLCEEFEWERQELLRRIRDIEGSDVWLEEFMEEDNVGKLAMLLGKEQQRRLRM